MKTRNVTSRYILRNDVRTFPVRMFHAWGTRKMKSGMLSVCIAVFLLAVVAYGVAMEPAPTGDVIVVSSVAHVPGQMFGAAKE